jgi:hypothetical protein
MVENSIDVPAFMRPADASQANETSPFITPISAARNPFVKNVLGLLRPGGR